MTTASFPADRTARKPSKTMSLVALFGLWAALCTVFALVVTISDGWREHKEKSWPEAAAAIERCNVDPYRLVRRGTTRVNWHIACHISYTVGGQEVHSSIRSQSVSSSANRKEMTDWVNSHRPGTTIDVHYDPDSSKNAVLIETDMPYAGPHTPNNLKLLLIAAFLFAASMFAVRWMRSREASKNQPADAPVGLSGS